MTDPFRDDLLEAFERLRGWIKTGLRRVMEIPRKQPHYAAALLIVIGCEALGRLLYNKKEQVFVKELIARYGRISEAMAGDLFKALRHGLAHTYDTNYIRVGNRGPLIELIVCWTDTHRHLGRRDKPPGIYLNLPTLQRDLEGIFDRYRVQLRTATARTVSREWARERIQPASPRAETGWWEFMRETGRPR
jgi:hypothetical protein